MLCFISAQQELTGFNRTLCLAISYGGRDDILQSCIEISKMLNKRDLTVENIDENLISKYTSTGRLNIPDPDLIIRTSGELRMSNFFLWQAAYSEFAFIDCLCKKIQIDQTKLIFISMK